MNSHDSHPPVLVLLQQLLVLEVLRRAPPVEMSLHRGPTNHCEPDETLFGGVRSDRVLSCPPTCRGLEHVSSQTQDVLHFLFEVADPSVRVWEVLVEIDCLDHRVARDVRVERHRREGWVEIDVEVLYRLDLFQVLEFRVDQITAMRSVDVNAVCVCERWGMRTCFQHNHSGSS